MFGIAGLIYIVASAHTCLVVISVFQNSNALGIVRTAIVLGEIEVSSLSFETSKSDLRTNIVYSIRYRFHLACLGMRLVCKGYQLSLAHSR